MPGGDLLVGHREAGQRVDAGLLRPGQPFAVVVGLGEDRLPVLARQADHLQQLEAGGLPALRLDHRPVDQMNEGDQIGDPPFGHQHARRQLVGRRHQRVLQRQAGAREEHLEAAVEGRLEVVRQPEVGLGDQEVGIGLQPEPVGAVEAEHQAASRQRRQLGARPAHGGHDGGEALRGTDDAVAVEVHAELGEVDDEADLGVGRHAVERGGGRFHAVAEVDQHGAKAVIGERLRLFARRHRQAQQRQGEARAGSRSRAG